jgi:SAM-dependent methyltransferase
MPQQWFHNWFNSPYYHLLYSQRNQQEAEFFINNLCSRLKLNPHNHLFDIACGRGRHAVYLNQQGYDVTGIDLSIENIRYARQFENPTLHFYVHDMRSITYTNYFDAAFNLFTSFGYFDDDNDNIIALKAFNKALKDGGTLVLDYFNSNKVRACITPVANMTIEGINFHIEKHIEDNKIIKSIKFEAEGQVYDFTERVSLFGLNNFEQFFKQSGFTITGYYGSYSLDEFDADTSDRLIFICRKTHV